MDKFFGERELRKPVLLKLDVQGYEGKVLAGATETMKRVRWLVAEASLRRMYEEEPLLLDLVELLRANGFNFLRPVGWLSDPRNGEMLQVDALFEREAIA